MHQRLGCGGHWGAQASTLPVSRWIWPLAKSHWNSGAAGASKATRGWICRLDRHGPGSCCPQPPFPMVGQRAVRSETAKTPGRVGGPLPGRFLLRRDAANHPPHHQVRTSDTSFYGTIVMFKYRFIVSCDCGVQFMVTLPLSASARPTAPAQLPRGGSAAC